VAPSGALTLKGEKTVEIKIDAVAAEEIPTQSVEEAKAAEAGLPSDATEESSGLPEWLPEQYAVKKEDGTLDMAASAQKLAQANSELNKQFTQTKQTEATAEEPKAEEPKAEEPKAEEPKAETETELPEVPKVEGATPLTAEDLQTYADKYAQNSGELSAEDYAELEKRGYSKEIVDTYVRGVEAQTQAFYTEVTSVVPETVKLDSMVEWAKGGGVDAQFASQFDAALASNNAMVAQQAMKALVEKYTASEGTAPQTRVTGAGSTNSQSAYSNQEEFIRDIKDARYMSDPAYRKSVEAKLARSTSF